VSNRDAGIRATRATSPTSPQRQAESAPVHSDAPAASDVRADSPSNGGLKQPSTEPASSRPEEARRTRIIAIANQKGGVGKSTTAVSLGAALADLGHRVLVIDLDPQGNASTGMGIKHDARDVTIYDILSNDASSIEDAVVASPIRGLFAVPSTIDLAGAEIELVSKFSRELRLRRALEPLRASETYDFVFLDCPPSLGLLTVNALAAAEELIVPIQCEYYALEGLGQLLHNVRLVEQNLNPSLRLTGIIMTMFDSRTKLSEQVVGEVRRYFGERVYDVIIPRTVRLSEAPGFGQPITVYDPKSRGAESYRALAREVAERPVPEGEPMPVYDELPAVIMSAEQAGVEAPDDPEADSESAEEVEPPSGDDRSLGGGEGAQAAAPRRPDDRGDDRPLGRSGEQAATPGAPDIPDFVAHGPSAPAGPAISPADEGSTTAGPPAPKPPQRSSTDVAEQHGRSRRAARRSTPPGEAAASPPNAPDVAAPQREGATPPPAQDSSPAPSRVAAAPEGSSTDAAARERRVVVIDERAEEAAVQSGQERPRRRSAEPVVADIGEQLPQEPSKRKKWWQFGKGGEG
jgi:chromosome partitioning protein